MAGPRVHVELGDDLRHVSLDGAPARADLSKQGVELREGLELVLVAAVEGGCRELDAVAHLKEGGWYAEGDPATDRLLPSEEQRHVRYPILVLAVAGAAFALWPLHLALTAHWCNWLGDGPAPDRKGYCEGLTPTVVSFLPTLVVAVGGVAAELVRSIVPLVIATCAALALFVLVPFLAV
jgi:hypothetical protein